MHIAITTLPGYSPQEKKLLARRLKDAAVNLMGVTPCTVSVSVKDLPIENWDDFIQKLPDDEIIIPETYREYIKHKK
ncbi:tautomerase family protein [Bacteroides fragilis]|uniref:tautomerase family protein n=1 Tax=Bacteroides TaxID=816 RepID=UPI001C707857|nr:tautomerase family protein [Bacteroides fragilis]MBW9277337.1 Tautomerase enzyme [Bacteroides fragilis]